MEILKGSGQVEIVNEFGSVFLYTHDNAKFLVEDVHTALSKRVRWDDPDYLARIIFCNMLVKEDWDKETGYGIGSQMYADINLLIRIDIAKQKIEINNILTKEKDTYMLDTFVNDYLKNVQL